MTATYEGHHSFTAPTWLGAKEPGHLTTCNTVESENGLFVQEVNHAEKRPEILHERDNCAKKHSSQHFLIRTEGFNGHCSGELDDSVEMTFRPQDPGNWRHKGSTMEFLIHIRKHILWRERGSIGNYWNEIVTALSEWLENMSWSCMNAFQKRKWCPRAAELSLSWQHFPSQSTSTIRTGRKIEIRMVVYYDHSSCFCRKKTISRKKSHTGFVSHPEKDEQTDLYYLQVST